MQSQSSASDPDAFERPRTTVKGRIVYDRKKHYFTQKDVDRILNSLAEDDPVIVDDLVDIWLNWAQRTLLRVLPGIFHRLVYISIHNQRPWWKKLFAGEFSSPKDAWLALVKWVFTNIREVLLGEGLEPLRVLGEVIALVRRELGIDPDPDDEEVADAGEGER